GREGCVGGGRERQMSGHQKLAIRRQLPQKFDADAGCLFGVVLEAVLPVGVFEPDLEHGVAGERQPVANEFMMAFQHITTEWCWGYAWGRPGLDKKTRSMINLAMLTALGKAPEIKLHVRGA